MTNAYHNQNDEQIVATINLLKGEQGEIKKSIKIAENELVNRKQLEITQALQKKPEPFGAVSEVIGNDKVTFTTPKKVDWDQDGLSSAYRQMIADGTEPSEYIQAEFKIKEGAYKNWPSHIKEFFAPYRTVKSGPVSIKIEPTKDK